MNFPFLSLPFLFHFLLPFCFARVERYPLHPLPFPQILPRQEPTAFTTARTANTEFAPPQTVTPPDPSATGTQTTAHEANTEIIPATTTGTPPPLITTDSRSANTQAIGPSTVGSTAGVVPTGVGVDVVLGGMIVGLVRLF
jgi:hypothetical protein